jgi:D-galactose 1-dehydrogenase
MAVSIALVGLGKIAHDQHVPNLRRNPHFKLDAIVSRRGATIDGLPVFKGIGELLEGMPGIEAVALATPPRGRLEQVLRALDAKKHVLIEKPPAASVTEFEIMKREAAKRDVTLFAAWHSQFNQAVSASADFLSQRNINSLSVRWKEDVRHWHPGQDWVFEAGGFGVFDPGINALSILHAILPAPIWVTSARLEVPKNRVTPVRAYLKFASQTEGADLTAEFDWLQAGPQTWDIDIATNDGHRVSLKDGGRRLLIDGNEKVAEPSEEYKEIYERFFDLIQTRRSEADGWPLRIVSDAFLLGEQAALEPFHW